MRRMMIALSVLLSTVLLPTVGLADDWTPPKNPDPFAILREAKADATRGHYKVALAKQLWYHENAEKLAPGQSGVRRSSALSYWLELGEAYPPALKKMRQVCDETEKRIRDETRVRVRFEDFHDFVAFNRTLRQESRTVETFKWLDQTNAKDARRMFKISRPALIKQKEYELCGKYTDPEHDVSRIGESYTEDMKMGGRFGKEYLQFVEKEFLSNATTLVAILAKNNRLAEAKKAAKDVQTFVTDDELSAKLQDALTTALNGTVPAPWR